MIGRSRRGALLTAGAALLVAVGAGASASRGADAASAGDSSADPNSFERQSATAMATYDLPEIPTVALKYRGAICRRTNVAVIGFIQSVEEYRVNDPTITIRTHVTVQVEKTIHGVAGKSLSFVMPAGRVDGAWTGLVTYPRVSPGQRYLLLLQEVSGVAAPPSSTPTERAGSNSATDTMGRGIWTGAQGSSPRPTAPDYKLVGAGRGAIGLEVEAPIPSSRVLEALWEFHCRDLPPDSEALPEIH